MIFDESRLPARITTGAEARALFALLIEAFGPHWHPDARSHNYVGDCPLAERLDNLIDQAFCVGIHPYRTAAALCEVAR